MAEGAARVMNPLPWGRGPSWGQDDNGGENMLWTIFTVLLVLWLVGLVSAHTMGGFIHILLILAIATLLINIIQGRRPL
jgi:hypothetical protein